MKKSISILIMAVAAACAQARTVAPVPVCTGTAECQQRWADAQSVIQNLARMPLRVVTDTRLETYPPTSSGRMGGVVTKHSVGDETFELRAELHCYGYQPCPDLENRGVVLFNRMMVSDTSGPDAVAPAR